MSTSMTAAAVLERCFLETRCKIIEIAAALDRIDRAGDAEAVAEDRRLRQIREALEVLGDGSSDRAARCQRVFSLSHDASWTPPNRE